MDIKFQRGKYDTIDTSNYPITLSDIKSESRYFQDNPTETSYDTYITNRLIPKIITNWEQETSFYILDQKRTAFLHTSGVVTYINTQCGMGISLNALNVRDVINISYIPFDSTNYEFINFNSTDYITSLEFLSEPKRIQFIKDILPIKLYNIKNNCKIEYNAGYENNDFSNMPKEIKEALILLASASFDNERGFCTMYDQIIDNIYYRYSIK